MMCWVGILMTGCSTPSTGPAPVLPKQDCMDNAWTPGGFWGPAQPNPSWRHHAVGLQLGDLKAKRLSARHILKAPVGWDCPARLDNSAYCTPLESQGDKPWCAAYSMGQLLSASYWRWAHIKADMPEAELYRIAKTLDPDPRSEGTTLESIISAAMCPTINLGVGLKPILETESVWELPDVIFAVHKYGLVLIGLQATKGWETLNKDGSIGPDKTIIGGHAVLVSGYDQPCKLIWGPNWWGKSWGRGGWWVMTYDQFSEQFGYGYGVKINWEKAQ